MRSEGDFLGGVDSGPRAKPDHLNGVGAIGLVYFATALLGRTHSRVL